LFTLQAAKDAHRKANLIKARRLLYAALKNLKRHEKARADAESLLHSTKKRLKTAALRVLCFVMIPSLTAGFLSALPPFREHPCQGFECFIFPAIGLVASFVAWQLSVRFWSRHRLIIIFLSVTALFLTVLLALV